MSEVLGTVKFLEDRIITKKNGVEEIWRRQSQLGNQYIQHNGYFYTLSSGESIEKVDDDFDEDINETDLDIWDDEV